MNRRSFFRRAAGFVAGLLGVPAVEPVFQRTTFINLEHDQALVPFDIQWGEFKVYTLPGEWMKEAIRGQ